MRGYRKFLFCFLSYFCVFCVLVDKGKEGKWAIIGPPAERQLNGVSLAIRWPKIEYWLGSFVIFSGDPDQYC